MLELLPSSWPALRLKQERVILPRYRAFLAEHIPCVVPGCCNPVTLHHTLGRGFARAAATDVCLLAICHRHGVTELHGVFGGNRAFELAYSVNFNERLNYQLQAYYAHNGWPFIHETQEAVEQFLLEQE